MGRINLAKALEVATEAALAAGQLIRAEFHRTGGPRHEGLHHADVDDEAEALIRTALTRAFPTFNFVGEETGSTTHRPGQPTWYVDPHDGTRAFIEGWRGSAVSIGLVVDGLPVLGVVYAPCAPTDEGDLLCWAEGRPLLRGGKPVSRPPLPATLTAEQVVLLSQKADRASEANHAACAPARFRAVPSIAYRCALVAAGEGEVAVSLNGPVAWDLAGGHALLRAVGGDLLDARGTPVRYGPRGAGSRFVFGGHPDVARTLSSRDWGTVLREARGGRDGQAPLLPAHEFKVSDPGVLDRAQGALLGQCIGDALGQMVEFRTEADILREYPKGVLDMADGGAWNTIAGQPTDDSELALSLARAIVSEGGFDVEAVRRAYLDWFGSRPFDIGGTTRAGLQGRPNHDSQANGALMRVSPLAVFAHTLPTDLLAPMARADAGLTHPNEVCLDASAVYAVALAHAVRTGATPVEVWRFAVDWAEKHHVHQSVLQALLDASRVPPGHYSERQGWVLTALGNAFFQLIHAESAEAGLLDTVRRGGDTDTNGAIAGALLGAVHGAHQLPLRWTRAVLSCRPIGSVHPRPSSYWPVDVPVLAEALVRLGLRHAVPTQEAEHGNVVSLFAKKESDEAYAQALEGAMERLQGSAATLFTVGVTLAMKKAWREWDKLQPEGATVTMTTKDLFDTEDPCVVAVARAIVALEQAWDALRETAEQGTAGNGGKS
jgi:ADP-ribosylglycohydrolase/fructose-1,6-bisphosphatase/inositol monophosphatase family enzyme